MLRDDLRFFPFGVFSRLSGRHCGSKDLVVKKLRVHTESALLQDAQKRSIRYLRISLTDRCNYACTYCVPAGGVVSVRQERLLRFEEIVHLTTLMASLGVRRVRLTGGEPTLRKNMVSLVRMLAKVPGIDEVVMTSNAHLLENFAKPLADAGLKGVNISLDTLVPSSFAKLTVRGDLSRVIKGVDACVEAGLAVSTNAVMLRGINDNEFPALCNFAWERGALPRFIESMPMSGGDAYSEHTSIAAKELHSALSDHFNETPISQGIVSARGPARYWSFSKAEGNERSFGVISAMSEHFCSSCNRLRLSATGTLHTCLAHDDTLDLKALLRSEATDSTVADAIRLALSRKKEGHEFELSGGGGPSKHMISIGG